MSVNGVSSSGSNYYGGEINPITLEVFLHRFLDLSSDSPEPNQKLLENLFPLMDAISKDLLTVELRGIIQRWNPGYENHEVEERLNAILGFEHLVNGTEEARMMVQALFQATGVEFQGQGSDSSDVDDSRDSVFANIGVTPQLPKPRFPASTPFLVDSSGQLDGSIIIHEDTPEGLRRDIFKDFDSDNDASAASGGEPSRS